MKTYLFPLDHFGVVASPLIVDLVSMTGDKRKRKSALGSLVRMAKATKQIPKDAEVLSAGLSVDTAGQISLALQVARPCDEEASNANNASPSRSP